jgi:hypothetical protein
VPAVLDKEWESLVLRKPFQINDLQNVTLP